MLLILCWVAYSITLSNAYLIPEITMRAILLVLTLVLSVDFSDCLLFSAEPPPNILLIVSDDQGYHDLGCYGSKEIKTPNLDRIAAGGVRLTSFYVTWPACTPSRGSLLTGRYPQRNGIYDMIRNEAPDYGHKYKPAEYAATWERIGGMGTREILLPRILKSAGYRSAIFGKWDLGMHKRFLPIARGFDQFYGLVNTGIDYFTHERYGVPSMYRNNTPTIEDKGTYATYLFEREALRFLNEHHKSHADQPWFLYLPFNAPHGASNLDSKIRSAAQGPEKYKKMYPHLKTEYRNSTRYGKPAQRHTKASARLEYLAAVTAMDDSIGKVLDWIEEHKQTGRTIVIFFSDNGGGGSADNAPLRGKKGDMYEGGIRVPALVRWPGRIAPKTVNNEFLTSMEILPLLVKAAGLDSDKVLPEVTLDGFDMADVLAGKAKSKRREMFWQRRNQRAARVDHWKWIKNSRGEYLFDLAKDIGEKTDLSKAKPIQLKLMRARFAAWEKQMNEAAPRGPFRDY